jgi:hypothetical protein
LARCGSAAGSIFTTGPTMTICHEGSVSARRATRSRSRRSSITPKKPSRGMAMPPCSASARCIAAVSAVARWAE